jgi:hypothetical protein
VTLGPGEWPDPVAVRLHAGISDSERADVHELDLLGDRATVRAAAVTTAP